jgi:hypothetical protein
MHEGLRLVSDDDREVRARTLREYQQATGSGFYPLSNVEMQVATRMFERPLSILSILQTGSLAERSFMDHPRVGLADISLLPATLLFCTEDMTSDPNVGQKRASLEQKSIRDLISAGEAKITDVASDVLGVESDDCRTFMFEIMRADVNGDGRSRYGYPLGRKTDRWYTADGLRNCTHSSISRRNVLGNRGGRRADCRLMCIEVDTCNAICATKSLPAGSASGRDAKSQAHARGGSP